VSHLPEMGRLRPSCELREATREERDLMRRLLIPTAVSGLILLLAVCLMLVYRPGFSRPDGLTSSNGSGRKPGTSESLPASDEPSDRKRDEAADGDAAADGTGVACLHGKVKDEAGRGLGGASVILKPMTDDLSRTGGIASRSFARGCSAGSGRGHGVRRHGPDRVRRILLDPHRIDPPRDLSSACTPRGLCPPVGNMELGPGSTELNFQLGLGDTITGRVLGPDGKPSKAPPWKRSCRINWRGGPRRGEQLADSTETDIEGKFRVVVFGGRFHLVASSGVTPRGKRATWTRAPRMSSSSSGPRGILRAASWTKWSADQQARVFALNRRLQRR